MENFIHPEHRLGAVFTEAPNCVQSLSARANIATSSPQSVNWFNALSADGDMLGNNQYGNCWWVARRWCITLKRALVAGDFTRPTASECLQDYTFTGFNIVSGVPDQGTDISNAMTNWSTKGLWLNQQVLDIPRWLVADPTNDKEVMVALHSCGPLMATWRLPMAMQDLTIWDQAPGTGTDWNTLWGEHETCLGASDGKQEVAIRTWGQDLNVHPEIRKKYIIRIDVPLDMAPGGWLDTHGQTPAGLDRDAIIRDSALLQA
jgi:hypothetical protein